MEELEKKFTTETLLKKIPAEKGWKITAKILLNLHLLRGTKTVVPLLGKDEGIFAPVWGWEKYKEIVIKVMGDSIKNMVVKVKELFNIPVEDAIGAENAATVAGTFHTGPDRQDVIVEKNPEKVVKRLLNCPWRETYKEYDIKPELTLCAPVCEVSFDKGLKEINPKLSQKLTKSLDKGDPYCEFVTEFNEE